MIVIDYRQLLDKIDNPPYTLYSAGDRAAWLDECITTAHAFEAEPVKHGRWEYDHTIGGMKHYRCTNCKNSGNECIADENEILWWNFCPRCGCKLDLGGDNNDEP